MATPLIGRILGGVRTKVVAFLSPPPSPQPPSKVETAANPLELRGNLLQRRKLAKFLRRNDISISRVDKLGYSQYFLDDPAKYDEMLRLIGTHKPLGWSSYGEECVEKGICSRAEFLLAMDRNGGDV